MQNEKVYPIYRKLTNNRSYYKILNDREFEEIQVVGTRTMSYKHVAKQYPEILFIQDLIDFSHSGIIQSNAFEFNDLHK